MKDKVIIITLQILLFIAVVAVIVTGHMYFEWVKEMATAEALNGLHSVTS